MSGACEPWSRCYDLGNRCRARDPRAAEDADEDVLPLRNGLRGGENTQTCPVCLGFPGALPVINRRAVEWTVKLGLALGCQIAAPCGLRAEELLLPRPVKGLSDLAVRYAVLRERQDASSEARGRARGRIVRAHLEEDAGEDRAPGRATGRIGGADYSLVDYNRGGTPLLEIVTAPDIRSAEEAKRFLQLLRQTVVELGISDAEMEKGTLRVDANVSVRPAGSGELRTRCEIKNMNSFNYVARGIEAEAARQIAIWDRAARSGRRRSTSTRTRGR